MPAPPPSISCQPAYFTTWQFVLKMLQVITSIVIMALTSGYWGDGRIYVCSAMAAVGLMVSILWIVLYAINLNARFPKFFDMLLLGYHVLILILYVVIAGCALSLFSVSSFIVAGVLAIVAIISLLGDIILNIKWMRGMEDEDELTPICSNKAVDTEDI